MIIIELLLLILSLVSCTNDNEIRNTNFIASMAIDYNNNYNIYFLSIENDLAKYYNTFGNTIDECIRYLELSTSLNISLKHVSTIILNNNSLNNKVINDLKNYLLDSLKLSLNFYLFYTYDNYKDIYSIKLPKEMNGMLNVLIEPVYSNSIYYNINPLHIMNFYYNYYNNQICNIPILKLNKLNDDYSIIIDNIYKYRK